MSFETDMKAHDEQWNETEAATGPVLFTDGTHQAQITMARIEEHADFGWQWVIGVRGTDSNTGKPASMRKWHGLPPSDEGYEFVKADAVTLGYTGDLSQLEKACIAGAFDGLLVEIYVKSKPGKNDPTRTFSNMYFNRVLGEGEVADDFPAADADDIPF